MWGWTFTPWRCSEASKDDQEKPLAIDPWNTHVGAYADYWLSLPKEGRGRLEAGRLSVFEDGRLASTFASGHHPGYQPRRGSDRQVVARRRCAALRKSACMLCRGTQR